MPGELYCLRCRSPKSALGQMADCLPVTAMLGTLIAFCSVCEATMYRRVNLAKLERVRGKLDITMRLAMPQLVESTQPSLNHDLKQEAADHAKPQPE